MKYYTYKLNMIFLNIMCVIVFLFMMLVMILFYPGELLFFVKNDSMILFICLLVIWTILHELIHYIGFRVFKEVDQHNLTLGIKLEYGICYCMCKQKIMKKLFCFLFFYHL